MRTRISILAALALVVSTAAAQNPRQQPGAPITIYAPEQHDLYDGHFVISAGRVHMVGTLNDPPGWNHMDNEAKTVRPVSGTAEIDVDEIKNTGKFDAPEDSRRRSRAVDRSLQRVQPLPERRHRRHAPRARHRFRLRR